MKKRLAHHRELRDGLLNAGVHYKTLE